MYFPKSQIETNLYSNNDLTILNTGKLYVGFYWATSNGKFFVGKTPEDPNSHIELVQASSTAASNAASLEPNLGKEQPFYVYYLKNLDYIKLANIKGNPPSSPKYIPAQPTLEDYQKGYFQRYFCKKINEIKFIETSIEEYIKLKNQDEDIAFNLYNPFILQWVISGDKKQVAIKNKNTVDSLQKPNKGFIGLNNYLKSNYLQFYSLYSLGGEFLLPNGKNYTGFYHIHPDKGPMVGKRHVSYLHQVLTPVNTSLPSTEVNNPQTPSSPPIDPPSSDIYNGSSNTPGGY